MNRATWQQLSTERIEDAQALLEVSRWSGAYYLAGYSLECALKSCILSRIDLAEIFFKTGKKDYQKNCWTHDLKTLVEQADLEKERDIATDADDKLFGNWQFAKDWNENSRYEVIPQQKAENLFAAINDKTDGVLQWVKKFW